jgi:hypothetical protein
MSMRRFHAASLMVLLAGALTAHAGEAPAPPVQVERRDLKGDDTPYLRFLHANRDFLRGRLDLLRQQSLPIDGQARALSERELFLQRILADIAAARDSLRTESALLADSTAVATQLADLARLANRLDLMDRQLDAQGQRLRDLDALLRGEQETALIVLLKGLPAGFEPPGLSIRDVDGASWQVTLDAGQRAALRRGGLVQVLHEYVEPREHRLEFSFGGTGLLKVLADAPLDRLTLLQLDLSALRSDADLSGITATIWQD